MAPKGHEDVPDWQTSPFLNPQSFARPIPTAIQSAQVFQLLQGIIVGVGVRGTGVGVGAQTFWLTEQEVQFHIPDDGQVLTVPV